MTIIDDWFAPLVSLLLSLAVTWLLQTRFANLIVDRPNDRSMHTTDIPRTGGLAINAGVVLGMIAAFTGTGFPFGLVIIAGYVAVLGVSVLDDILSLGAVPRLAIHLLAATLLVTELFPVRLMIDSAMFAGLLITVMSVLAATWFINLYNFMDGMDGFSSGMAIFGFAVLAIIGFGAGHEAYGMTCLVICAAVAGFLVFNYPPARIFMGDSGSIVIGYMGATMMLWGAAAGTVPPWLGILAFSPFIFDASYTLAKRTIKGDSILSAHRDHFYQRLVLSGVSKKTVLWLEYGLMAACAGTAVAIAGYGMTVQLAGCAIWLVVYSGLAIVAERYLRDRIH
ncbi:MAG: glycosyltransferase family 4 protein [Gammaproteobacteria bacterium]|nr:glycosyltransferase family 4 protein [Gammaproteobacteria bacterium]